MSAAASRKRVICVGHAALDRVFAVESWPAGSGKIAAHRFAESGGGMAANAATAIVQPITLFFRSAGSKPIRAMTAKADCAERWTTVR